MNSTATEFAVAAWPGVPSPGCCDTTGDRGLRRLPRRRRIPARSTMRTRLLDQVDLSGLLGRGGAAFPMAIKLRTVRDTGAAAQRPVVVANGEEGEPASVKDRWLLRNRPHLVLDGLRLAAGIVGARRAYVYVSDAQAATAVRIRARRDRRGRVRRGQGPCGDRRTRLRRGRGDRRGARDQRRPRQTHRQAATPVRRGSRRRADHGEQRRNARQPAVHPPARGAKVPVGRARRCRRARSSRRSPVRARPAALYEIPHGARSPSCWSCTACPPTGAGRADGRLLRRPAEQRGSGRHARPRVDAPARQRAGLRSDLDPDRRLPGGRRGIGDGVLRPRERGPVRIVFQRHGGDGRGRRRSRDGAATDEDLARLERWSVVLRGRGACATLDGATYIAASLFCQFPQTLTAT